MHFQGKRTVQHHHLSVYHQLSSVTKRDNINTEWNQISPTFDWYGFLVDRGGGKFRKSSVKGAKKLLVLLMRN